MFVIHLQEMRRKKVMGINYTKAELFDLFKQEEVTYDQVEVGDILTSFTPFVVSEVKINQGDKTITILDRDKNATTATPNMRVKRILQSSLI